MLSLNKHGAKQGFKNASRGHRFHLLPSPLSPIFAEHLTVIKARKFFTGGRG
jgi:hypothetical protein